MLGAPSQLMVSLSGLGKRFGAQQALSGIDLQIGEAEIVAVIGPSGSGKSTLLRYINLLEAPTEGRIEIDGSFYDGMAGNAALTAQLQKAAGPVPVTTASGAVRAALAALGLRRPAVGTPYSADVTDRLIRFLHEAGHDPATVERLHADYGDIDDYTLQDVAPERLAAFIARLGAAPGADGVLLSCTGLATATLAPRMEPQIGRPIITSNLALLWHCWRLGAIRPSLLCDAALMRAPLPPDPIPMASSAERTAP